MSASFPDRLKSSHHRINDPGGDPRKFNMGMVRAGIPSTSLCQHEDDLCSMFLVSTVSTVEVYFWFLDVYSHSGESTEFSVLCPVEGTARVRFKGPQHSQATDTKRIPSPCESEQRKLVQC